MEVKDAGTIIKIAMAVASLFSFNDIQKKEIEQYAKNNANTWISERKRENEIETMIKNQANIISK